MFCKKGVLKDFAKLTTPKPATFLKKKLRHRFFPVNFTKYLGTSFLYRISLVALPPVLIPWKTVFTKSLKFSLNY